MLFQQLQAHQGITELLTNLQVTSHRDLIFKSFLSTESPFESASELYRDVRVPLRWILENGFRDIEDNVCTLVGGLTLGICTQQRLVVDIKQRIQRNRANERTSSGYDSLAQ
jgi:hypothetical protein